MLTGNEVACEVRAGVTIRKSSTEWRHTIGDFSGIENRDTGTSGTWFNRLVAVVTDTRVSRGRSLGKLFI